MWETASERKVSRDTYLPWWGRRFRLPSQLFPVPEYRRRLPHFHPNDSHLFLTWRLWGSLPSGTEKAAPHLTPGQAFAAVDHSLDRLDSGPLWLKDQRIAKRVSHAVLIGADERRFHDLCAYSFGRVGLLGGTLALVQCRMAGETACPPLQPSGKM